MERALGEIQFSIFLWNVQPPECCLFAMASSLSSCKLPSVFLFFNERVPLNSIGCLGWDIYPQTDPSRHLVGAFFQVHNNFRHCFKDENGTYISNNIGPGYIPASRISKIYPYKPGVEQSPFLVLVLP